MLKKIIKCFVKPQLSKEAFFAYFHRLPDKIQVKWNKKNGLIIGVVSDGKKVYYTQGKNPDDFVNMVNDVVYTMYDIPEDYYETLSKCKAYIPNELERKKLGLESIRHSDISLKKKALISA